MSADRVGTFLRPPLQELRRHPALFGDDDATRVRLLAEALATSPPWVTLGERLALAVRTEPEPLIGLLGPTLPEDLGVLDALTWQVSGALERLHPVPWEEAVELVTLLAARLRAGWSDLLDTAAFVAIPRGGTLVGALLSYALDRPELLLPRPADVVVVIDDCILSGSRLRQWLRHHDARRIIVAHLHSHPGARAAIEQDERVIGCVAAADLAAWPTGSGEVEFRARWQERSPDDFWAGLTDHVVYPWNEPDLVYWDDVVGAVQPGWHVAPPSWCFKNRDPGASSPPYWCRPPDGPVRPEPAVLWCPVEEGLALADAESQRAVLLRGVAGELWEALMRTGDPDTAAEAVASSYEVELHRVRDDLEGLIARLRSGGFLAS